MIYVIQCHDAYKIGVSQKPRKRLKQAQTYNPSQLVLLFAGTPKNVTYHYDGGDYVLEGQLHERYQDLLIHGEWFKLHPEDVKYISSLLLVTLRDVVAPMRDGLLHGANRWQDSGIKPRGIGRPRIYKNDRERWRVNKRRQRSIIPDGIGRPRIYANKALKQKAYRQRVKDRTSPVSKSFNLPLFDG
jgi:hypothetical protein